MNAVATLPVPRTHVPLGATSRSGWAPLVVVERDQVRLGFEQESAFVSAVARCWTPGATAGEARRDAAEAGVRQLYAQVGRDAPAVVWTATPCLGAVAATAIDAQSSERVRSDCLVALDAAGAGPPRGGAAPRRSLWPLVRERVWEETDRRVSEGFGADIGHRIHIEGLIAEAFRVEGADSSAEEARLHVGRVVTRVTDEHGPLAWQHPIDAEVGDGASCRGRLGGDAIAVFDVLHRVSDPEVRSMAAVAQLARNCLYWWPFDGLVVLTERLHEPDGCPFAQDRTG